MSDDIDMKVSRTTPGSDQDESGPNSMAAQAHERTGYCTLDRLGARVHYVEVGAIWLSAGAPYARGPVSRASCDAFELAACAQRRGMVYFGVGKAFAARMGLSYLPLGEEPLWDPATWRRVGRRQRSVHSQLKRAERHGVQVTEAQVGPTGAPVALATQMAELLASWRASQALPAMGFVVGLHGLRDAQGERLFVARVGERVVGFATLLTTQGGVLLEHLVRARRAPNGTTEALVDAVMLASTESPWVSLGFVPLAGALPGWLQVARRLGEPFYSFRGLDTYRRKLGPHKRVMLGLAYPPQRSGFAVPLYSLLRAFACGPLLVFLGRLIARGPQPVLATLAFMLPLWTVGLACLPSHTWFPNAWVQQAWVAFDVALSVLLVAALRRPSARGYLMLGWIIAGDTVLTALEAWLYPGPRDALGLVMHGLGVMAPGLGAVVLFGAARRLAILEGNGTHALSAAECGPNA